MVISETDHLLELWSKNICPWCGKEIEAFSRIGTGRKREGGFCSLDCYAKYYSVELQERAQRVSELVKRNS